MEENKATYLAFLFLGSGTLLCMCTCLTDTVFFMAKFHNTSTNYSETSHNRTLTSLQSYFESSMAAIINLAALLTSIVGVLTAHSWSINKKINYGYLLQVICLLLILPTIYLNTDSWQIIYFIFILLNSAIVSVGSSILQSGLFGICGEMSSNSIRAFNSGQGLSGVTASLSKILFVSFKTGYLASTMGFFSLTTVFLIGNFLVYNFFIKRKIKKIKLMKHQPEEEDMNDEISIVSNEKSKNSIFQIFFKIKFYSFILGLSFFITLAIQPGVTVHMLPNSRSPEYSIWYDELFVVTLCFLTNGLGEFSGRVLTAFYIPKRKWTILIYVIIRIMFIPTILFCKLRQPNPSNLIPVYIHNEYILGLLIFLFSVSSGHLSTSMIIEAPKYVQKNEQHVTGTIMYLSIVIGLSIDLFNVASNYDMEVVDRYHLTYISFFILGLGTLLPWNFLITADTFFDYKFRNTSIEYGNGTCHTALCDKFESILSAFANTSNFLFLLIGTLFARSITAKKRVLFGLSLLSVALIVLIITIYLNTDSIQTIYFYLIMVIASIMSACSAIIQTGEFGLAAILPMRYTQAVMAGQALGGVFASLSAILSVAINPQPLISAYIFFGIGLFVILVNIVIFLCLIKSKYLQYHQQLGEENESLINHGGQSTSSEENKYDYVEPVLKTGMLSYDVKQRKYDINGNSKSSSNESVGFNEEQSTNVNTSNSTLNKDPLLQIFNEIKLPGILVACVFLLTLAMFPGTIASIRPQNKPLGYSLWYSRLFTKVLCFLVFNVGDFSGRLTAGYLRHPSTSRNLIIYTCLRILFIPLMFFCNIGPSIRSFTFFKSEYIFAFINFIFSFSNGHLGSLLMMVGPKYAAEKNQEVAGSIMAFALGTGLCLGSILSVGMSSLNRVM
ncbi:hypothetical protein SNEBB_006810 [Seison nebaliae]|nr:hypothetical protein SNEBB_006810 [Seison nebaliae]